VSVAAAAITGTTTTTDAERVAPNVQKILNDNTRRKRNVVVAGIPETGCIVHGRI